MGTITLSFMIQNEKKSVFIYFVLLMNQHGNIDVMGEERETSKQKA